MFEQYSPCDVELLNWLSMYTALSC